MILDILNYWATNIPFELVLLDVAYIWLLLVGYRNLNVLTKRDDVNTGVTLLILTIIV